MDKWFDNLLKQYFKEEYNDNENINYQNSLHPKRSIGNINIEKNTITGTIYPNGKKPIKLEISFKKFSSAEKQIITDIINKNTKNKLKIEHGVLPDEILNVINPLPSTIDDLKIRYIDSQAIDKIKDVLSILEKFNEKLQRNYFLIFKMKGIDLKKRNSTHVKTIDDLLIPDFKTKTKKKGLRDLGEINCIILKDIEKPSKNFEIMYSEMFDYIRSEMKSLINKFNRDYSKRCKTQKEKVIDDKSKISININRKYKITNPTIKNEKELFLLLYEFNHLSMDDVDWSVDYLCNIVRLTIRLIEKNALVPQCFYTPQYYGCLRWIPAFYYEAVINLCKSYCNDCPEDLITFDGEKLSKADQVIFAIGLIMAGIIHYCIEKKRIKSFDPSISTTMFKLFTSKQVNLSSNKNITPLKILSKKTMPFYFYELDYNYHISIKGDLIARILIKNGDELKTLSEGSKDEIRNSKIIYDIFKQYKVECELFEDIPLSNNNFSSIIQNIRPIFEMINITIDTPVKLKKATYSLQLNTQLDENSFNYQNLKQIKCYVIIEENKIPLDEFDKQTQPDSEIITIDETAYMLYYDSYYLLKSRIPEILNLDGSGILKLALLRQFKGLDLKIGYNLKTLLRLRKNYQPPKSLKCALNRYQELAYSMIVQKIKTGFGYILTDNIWLGKTLEILSAVTYLKEEQFIDKCILLIAPEVFIGNWECEIAKYTPNLKYYTYTGYGEKLPYDKNDIILTSYEIIGNYLEIFKEYKWGLIVADEAQKIKDSNAFTTLAIKSISANSKIALIDAYIKNNILEYSSLFDFVNSHYLDNISEEYTNIDIRRITRPFIFKRKKEELDNVKISKKQSIHDIYCNINEKQKNLYEIVLNDTLNEIKRLSGKKRLGKIVKLMNDLKKICNHPVLYSKYRNPQIEDSSKTSLLMELMEKISNEKVIIFTQFIKMGQLIKDYVNERFECEVLFLNGRVRPENRLKIIKKFEKSEKSKILVSTIQSGNSNLSLDSADHIIYFDSGHHITDKSKPQNVWITRLISKGVLDENIESIISDEDYLMNLSDDDLKELLSLK